MARLWRRISRTEDKRKMTENEKIELFDKWYDENYDEWAEGEEGIALREELEQAFKGGIAELEKENAGLKNRNQELLESCEGATMMYKDLQKSKEIIKKLLHTLENKDSEYTFALKPTHPVLVEAEQFIKEGEKKDD